MRVGVEVVAEYRADENLSGDPQILAVAATKAERSGEVCACRFADNDRSIAVGSDADPSSASHVNAATQSSSAAGYGSSGASL